MRAGDLDGVRAKVGIWRALAGQGRDDAIDGPLDRLVLSNEADPARLQRMRR